MPGDARYTACCGLYCKDCIPSNEPLFATAAALEKMLSDLQFERYAALKARQHPAFEHYPAFARVLAELKELRCSSLCTEGGCTVDCRIRACVQEKGFRGCWECAGFEGCGLLEPMVAHHPDLRHNLQMIGQYGPDDWSERRGRHYRWSR